MKKCKVALYEDRGVWSFEHDYNWKSLTKGKERMGGNVWDSPSLLISFWDGRCVTVREAKTQRHGCQWSCGGAAEGKQWARTSCIKSYMLYCTVPFNHNIYINEPNVNGLWWSYDFNLLTFDNPCTVLHNCLVQVSTLCEKWLEWTALKC